MTDIWQEIFKRPAVDPIGVYHEHGRRLAEDW